MRKMQGKTLAWVAAFALLLGGCAGTGTPAASKQPTGTSVPLQSPAPAPAQQSTNTPNPHPILGGSEQSARPAPAPNKGAVKPGNAKLVPMPDRENIQFKMLIPEGAQITSTLLGDGLQVFMDQAMVNVHHWQLRGEKPPATLEEAVKQAKEWAPDATVKQLQLPGTVVAYELEYSQVRQGVTTQVIEHDLYGTTYQTTINCEAPATEFAAWEPVFRQMLASFQPGNLNAEPLPGRP